MPSVSDVYDQLTQANGWLETIHQDLQDSNGKLQSLLDVATSGFSDVINELKTLIDGQVVTNRDLLHISHQADTMICELDDISEHTCGSLNEEHAQTGLERSMNESVGGMLTIVETVHPDAALERARLAKLEEELKACCPPEEEPAFCTFERCERPEPLEERPDIR